MTCAADSKPRGVRCSWRHAVPDLMALFDFHVDNMLLLPGRPGIKASWVALDFQDAVRAPLTFDLVAVGGRPPLGAEADLMMAAMIDRYLAANPQIARRIS